MRLSDYITELTDTMNQIKVSANEPSTTPEEVAYRDKYMMLRDVLYSLDEITVL